MLHTFLSAASVTALLKSFKGLFRLKFETASFKDEIEVDTRTP